MVKIYKNKCISLVILMCMFIQIFIPPMAFAEELPYDGDYVYETRNDTNITMLENQCMHGKISGETCYECGQLVHSDKNLPLIGCSEEFFLAVQSPDDCDEEDILRYNMKNIRMVCEHIVADGLYCEDCSKVVDIQAGDYIDCAIFDSCIHGRIAGEKCEECKELKIEQGDYELSDGEEWDDPLIYPTETLVSGKFALRCEVDILGYKHYYCPWCDYEFGDNMWWTLNVHHHGSEYRNAACGGWSKPALYAMLTGTCRNHSSKQVWQCGHVDGKWFSHEYWTPIHSYKVIGEESSQSTASCQAAGKTVVKELFRCSICGATKYGTERTETIAQLDHKYSSVVYKNSLQHDIVCEGVNCASHRTQANHSWVDAGEDRYCDKKAMGCDAFQTRVHLDAYIMSEEGKSLLKSDVAQVWSGASSLSIGNQMVTAKDYMDKAPAVIALDGIKYAVCDNEQQIDSVQLQAGGVRVKLLYERVIDKSAYTVEHYKETAVGSGQFELADTVTGEYAIGQMFRAEFKNYAGFKPSEDSVQDIEIAKDRDNIVKLYYTMRELPFQDEFAVYVPKSISVNIDKDGVCTVAGNPLVINAAQKRSVQIKNIILNGIDGWTFMSDKTALEGLDKGSKVLAVSINGDKAVGNGNVADVELRAARWIIPADAAVPLILNVAAATQQETLASVKAFTIEFTADWSEADPPELFEHKVTLVDTDNGIIDTSVNKELFTVNEQIPELPVCEPGYLYRCVGWKCLETGERVSAGDVVTQDVTLQPIYELRGKIINISISPNRTDWGDVNQYDMKTVVGDTLGELIAHYNIKATPANQGCVFKGYTTGLEGVLGFLTDDYIFEQGQVLTAVFEDTQCQYEVMVKEPDAHGLIVNGVTKIITAPGGKLTVLPKVDAENLYELDRWINISTGATVELGQILNSNITIKPIMKLRDDVITIKIDADFYANLSSYGSVYAEAGQTWGEISKPTATAASGYQLMGWYNGDELLADDYVITKNFTAKMKSAKDMASYFYFSDNGDGTVSLTGWRNTLSNEVKNGSIDELVLPSYYNGKPVTTVARGFKGSRGSHIRPAEIGFTINRLVIPRSIKTIQEEAFAYNDVVKSYVFSEGLEVIGNSAFAENTAITSISLPSTVTNTGNGAFEDCTGIVDVYVPASILNNAEGRNLFDGCTGIRSWSAPRDTIRVPNGMFTGCKNLASVTLVDTVTTISDSAFSGCSRLTAITLPEGLTELGWMAFSSTALKEITVPVGVKTLDSTFSYCSSLKTVVLEGVETIGTSTFLGCTGLQTGVSLPDTLRTICSSAFGNCSNIFLEVPETVEVIQQQAFSGAYHIYYYGKAVDGANDNWGAKLRN